MINVLFESSRKRLFFLDNTHSSQRATPKLLAILAELVINTRTPCADYKHKVKINFIYYYPHHTRVVRLFFYKKKKCFYFENLIYKCFFFLKNEFNLSISILLFKGLHLFELDFFLFQNTHTFLYLSRDKTKG